MSIVTNRKEVEKIYDKLRDKEIVMPTFCTGSFWNTEAIVLAAQRFAEKYGIAKVPVSLSITYCLENSPQSKRMLYCGIPQTGLRAHMRFLDVLCNDSFSPYKNVIVMPHLDHADPERDHWALTEGRENFATIMFDAQRFPLEKNIELTSAYVKKFGSDVMIEGIVDRLKTHGEKVTNEHATDWDYAKNVKDYMDKTKVDFVVVDLGTEQQASSGEKAKYLSERARTLNKSLDRASLVVHGGSSLAEEILPVLASDGIIRANMWTRIVRSAGKYAYEQMRERDKAIVSEDFESIESRMYTRDSVEKASEIMEEIFSLLGFAKL